VGGQHAATTLGYIGSGSNCIVTRLALARTLSDYVERYCVLCPSFPAGLDVWQHAHQRGIDTHQARTTRSHIPNLQQLYPRVSPCVNGHDCSYSVVARSDCRRSRSAGSSCCACTLPPSSAGHTNL